MTRVKISYHGTIRRIVGKEEEIVDFPQDISLHSLLDSLGERYGEEFECRVRNPGSSSIIADLVIAVDGVVVDNLDIPLQGNREIDIAVIPQMLGGEDLIKLVRAGFDSLPRPSSLPLHPRAGSGTSCLTR